MLHGNFVHVSRPSYKSRTYYPGARENQQGLAFLSADYIQNNKKQAFDKFKRAAELGHIQGQIYNARQGRRYAGIPRHLSKNPASFQRKSSNCNAPVSVTADQHSIPGKIR